MLLLLLLPAAAALGCCWCWSGSALLLWSDGPGGPGSCAAVPMLSHQPRACDGHRGGRDLGGWIGGIWWFEMVRGQQRRRRHRHGHAFFVDLPPYAPRPIKSTIARAFWVKCTLEGEGNYIQPFFKMCLYL